MAETIPILTSIPTITFRCHIVFNMNIESFIFSDKELPVEQSESVHHQIAINSSDYSGSCLLVVVLLVGIICFENR